MLRTLDHHTNLRQGENTGFMSLTVPAADPGRGILQLDSRPDDARKPVNQHLVLTPMAVFMV
jgi:hypothetical protein